MSEIIKAEYVEAKAEPTCGVVAENLVKAAEKSLKLHGDDKLYVHLDELCSLIGVGGTLVELNGKSIGGGYNHFILYRGYKFISHSSLPIAPNITQSLL